MTSGPENLVLPRPGALPTRPKPPISGPSEQAFTSAFGTLLPPVRYLDTSHGKVACYNISPTPSVQTLNRVLVIHGVQTPALGMLPLAAALHSLFPDSQFALLDLWGHGLSDTPILPHDAALFHELFDEMLDELYWPSAHLMGYSFGASLTVGYADSRTSRVNSFTLVAPAGLIRSTSFTAAEQELFQPGSDEDAARKWVLQFLEGKDLVVPGGWKERVGRGEVVAEAVREWQMREHAGHVGSVVAIFRDGGVMDNHESFTKAAQTRKPALVVLGEKDDLCNKQELRDLGFKDVFVVPQAGHGLVRERVPEVASFISNFWTDLGIV
ncbi:Valacyclovir hydrolase [Pyrenophora tritici-repentis]|nr:Valacyclovir hydrolase [Pyrenophora tritici-repentis]